LLIAIRKHMKNEDFLKYALFLLGSIVLDDTMKDYVGQQGGVELVVEIIGFYPGNSSLCENACYALASLTCEHPANIQSFVGARAIDLTLQLATTYQECPDLLENAIIVICNVCFQSEAIRDSVIASGGATVITDTILANFENLQVCVCV
jgi:hypothetical protein